MPSYTYRCDNCGTQLDVQQKFGEKTLKKCPVCSKDALVRVYKPVGIVFKGSGFYSTDNRSSSGRLNGSASTKTETSFEGATEKSSETKKTEGTSTESKKTSSEKVTEQK